MTLKGIWDKIDKEGPAAEGSGFHAHFKSFMRREDFATTMAWAVPSKWAIKRIAKFTNSILEIGAGLGLWAHLLRRAGVTVTATDYFAFRGNFIARGADNFTEVLDMKHTDAIKAYGHLHECLMLCWPPYSDPMAYEALKKFKGPKLIYIGEYDGCTADNTFQKYVENNFELEADVRIPQWLGLHDYLSLYRRNQENPMKRKIVWKSL